MEDGGNTKWRLELFINLENAFGAGKVRQRTASSQGVAASELKNFMQH